MALSKGSRIGPYEVVGLLGAGAMGEVYRARDTTLGRDVALKILHEAFTADRDRQVRFEREARALASLNHPNIGAIYGLERTSNAPPETTTALVLELVDGPTLAQVIERDGAQRLDRALNIGRQLADALDAAHEHGIIHRDLKPANIKITPDGHVKVLDFGLAKTIEAVGGAAHTGANRQLPPAETITAVSQGLVLGTPAYMSPEQARGQLVDKRTDIWAFGCVLYEMLSGRRPFARDTVTDTLAAVIEREPDWSALPVSLPTPLVRLLRRCLEKDPRVRLRDIGDVRADIDDALTAPMAGPARAPASGAVKWWPAGVTALAVLAAGASWAFRPASLEPGIAHLSMSFVERPRVAPFGSRHLAISDDGSVLAYGAASRLWIRRMGDPDAVAIGITGTNPFFSPDGNWVAVFDDDGIVKTPVSGGATTKVAKTTDRPAGAAWSARGVIVFATTEGLFQVRDTGGEAQLLAKPDRGRKERLYAWPEFLPDQQAILFTVVSESAETAPRIAWMDLGTREIRPVIDSGTSPRYLPSGYLVFADGGTLRAVKFSPGTGTALGTPVMLQSREVVTAPDNGAVDFAVSTTGTLVVMPSEAIVTSSAARTSRVLQWVDRQGTRERLALAPGRIGYPRVSPDGTRVALDRITGGKRDIWTLDLARLRLTQITDGPSEDMLPEWSPDGQRLFFASDRGGNFDVYSQAADGASAPKVELAAAGFQAPNAFTPDGSRMVIYDLFRDLAIVTLGRPDRSEPLLHGDADERLGQLSPDGRWVAYESNESGTEFEVFVRPFPNAGDRREKVSLAGGRYPRWSHDGHELFYVSAAGDMMAVAVTLSPALTLGASTKLFSTETPGGRSGRPYDISPIDGRFIMTAPVDRAGDAPTQISVVLNWLSDVSRPPNR